MKNISVGLFDTAQVVSGGNANSTYYIDMAGAERLHVSVWTLAAAPLNDTDKVVVVVQNSDDATTWTNISTAEYATTQITLNAAGVFSMDIEPMKRYYRLRYTLVGSPLTIVCAVGVRVGTRHKPKADTANLS